MRQFWSQRFARRGRAHLISHVQTLLTSACARLFSDRKKTIHDRFEFLLFDFVFSNLLMEKTPKAKFVEKRKLLTRSGLKMPQLPIQVNGDNYEPMELDVADSDDREELPVLDDVSLDLESYICHYHGIPRIHRLEFIADHCKSLRIEALTSAVNYIKENTYNVKEYTRLFKKLQEAKEERDGHSVGLLPDSAWIDTKTKQAGLRYERLENDLKNFSKNSMKENIRRGQDDLGDHFLDCGELENAFIAYSKSRDYVITHRNQINQCLNMIRVGILLKRWSAVSNHVLRAESQPNSDTQTNQAVSTKLHCAAGLFELNSRRYKKAAKHFLSTNFDHFNQPYSTSSTINRGIPHTMSSHHSSGPVASGSGLCSNFSSTIGNPHHDRDFPNSASQWELLAPVNIAVYGSLCALATYTRQELANHIINSASFKQFAELDPQLREAVARFYESKYAACLSILQEVKSILLLDMYLAPHVERLYRDIRNKAIVQYFEPYSTASMHKMAEAFNTTVIELEKEIIALIYDGHIKARIDSHNKILYAKNTDSRTLTFERAIKMGKIWQRQTQALITRTAILNAGLSVVSPTVNDRPGT